mgnify:CR=1 FL=1
MQYGKIVAIHGANISISVQSRDEQSGPVVAMMGQEERRIFHFDVTLPASSATDIDFAVEHVGMSVGFASVNGKVYFEKPEYWQKGYPSKEAFDKRVK